MTDEQMRDRNLVTVNGVRMLLAERDELVAALEEIATWTERSPVSPAAIAMAALAKVQS